MYLGAFVDISTTDVSICIHMNIFLFFHLCMCFCPYVHVYVNMHTHVHMYTFVHMYDLKRSKQSIDLCSNNTLITSAIFILIILAKEPLFSITHTLIFFVLFYQNHKSIFY